MTDGSTQDVTGSVTWSSANPGVAAISNDAGTRGLVTTQSIGTTSIVATSDAVVGNTTLTVGAAALVSIDVTPAEATLLVARRQQFTAIGTFTDGTTQDLTSSVTWSSEAVAVATISNGAGAQGRAEPSRSGQRLYSRPQVASRDPQSSSCSQASRWPASHSSPSTRASPFTRSTRTLGPDRGAGLSVCHRCRHCPFDGHPAGQFVYVGNASCCSAATDVITAFAVDAATGARPASRLAICRRRTTVVARLRPFGHVPVRRQSVVEQYLRLSGGRGDRSTDSCSRIAVCRTGVAERLWPRIHHWTFSTPLAASCRHSRSTPSPVVWHTQRRWRRHSNPSSSNQPAGTCLPPAPAFLQPLRLTSRLVSPSPLALRSRPSCRVSRRPPTARSLSAAAAVTAR